MDRRCKHCGFFAYFFKNVTGEFIKRVGSMSKDHEGKIFKQTHCTLITIAKDPDKRPEKNGIQEVPQVYLSVGHNSVACARAEI